MKSVRALAGLLLLLGCFQLAMAADGPSLELTYGESPVRTLRFSEKDHRIEVGVGTQKRSKIFAVPEFQKKIKDIRAQTNQMTWLPEAAEFCRNFIRIQDTVRTKKRAKLCLEDKPAAAGALDKLIKENQESVLAK